MRTQEVVEGKAKILIPDPSQYTREGKFDPAWSPVFYNQRMVFNRDLSILVANKLRVKRAIDALAATGVRGIRYYLEAGVPEVVINDINPVAFELIKENVKRNSVKAEVHNRNANSLLNEVKGDLVDVDPFGSPVPFIMSSLSALRNKGLLALTATDTSALTGSSPSSCRRKYGAINQRLSFHREVGLRILISKVVSEAASVDLAAYPTLTYYTDYYYRAYFRVVKGAKRADELLKRLGYYVECNKCGYSEGRSYVDQITCPRCGNSIMRIAGPLWMGELWDQEVLEGLTSELNEFSYLPSSRRVHKLLTTLKQETPYQNFHYWKIDWLCSIRKWSIPKKEKVIQCVGRASATHLDSNGIRSDAEFEDILKCLTHTS